MADRYWVGGTATWDATAGTKWATTSGGGGGSAVPTAADDVFFDAASGAVTCTLAADTTSVNCRSLNFTGYTGTFSHPASSTVNIGDATAGAGNIALLMTNIMTYTVVSGATSIMLFKSTSTTQQTIQCKTSGNMGAITINGVGSSYILSVNGFTQSSAGVFTLTSGIFNTGGFACTWGQFFSSSALARTLTMGASAITIAGGTTASAGGRSWDTSTNTNLTVTANTATITFTGTTNNYFYAGPVNLNGASIVANTSTGFFIQGSNPTFANVTRTQGSTNVFTGFTVTGTLTLGGLNATTGRGTIAPDNFGNTYAIVAAAISFSNINIEGCLASGAANWDISGITGNSGDVGGNTGITFTTPATQTATGTASFTWSSHSWTTRVPLPQDDVVINNAFVAGRTISADMRILGKNIDFTGMTGSPTLNNTGNAFLTGNLTLIAAMTVTGNSFIMLNRSGTKTFTQNGATVSTTGIFRFRSTDSTIELGSDMNTPSAEVNIDRGTFTTNNYTITSNRFSNATVNPATLNMGSSTINITGNNALPYTLSNTDPAFVYNGADATINIGSSTLARTIAGGGKSLGILNYIVSGSTASLSITGSNTFKEINFRDANNARSLLFTAGTTTTITNAFNVQGTPGRLMTVGSITAASHTLTDASGVISCDYMSISRSTATGGASWYAGANSTDGGNNTGWIFRKAPGSGSLMLTGAGT
jgi:hypothetical protein